MLPLLDAHREGSADEIMVPLALKLHQVLSPGLGPFSEWRVWLLAVLPTARSVFFRKCANFVVSGWHAFCAFWCWHVLHPSVGGMSREQTRLSFLLKWTVSGLWKEIERKDFSWPVPSRTKPRSRLHRPWQLSQVLLSVRGSFSECTCTCFQRWEDVCREKVLVMFNDLFYTVLILTAPLRCHYKPYGHPLKVSKLVFLRIAPECYSITTVAFKTF